MNTSGYTPSSASVMIPPEEPPTEYTRPASPPYFDRVYFTIWTMAPVSPPPLCLRARVEPASQQFSPVASGKMMMKPFLLAIETRLDISLYVPVPVPWQWCGATTIGGLAAGASG